MSSLANAASDHEEGDAPDQQQSPGGGPQAAVGAPSDQLQKKQPLAQQNRKPSSKMVGGRKVLNEVLPKAGLVYSEKGNLSEVLCKPKIMPIKSVTLEKIEQMDRDMAKAQ